METDKPKSESAKWYAMFGIGANGKPESVSEPEQACGHIFQGKCQLTNIVPTEQCRCSQYC